MTCKIARAEQHGKVLWLHFEGNKQRYKAWLDAPFSKDLVVGAEAEATFTTTPGKEVPDKPGEHYPDEIFIETWGGVSGERPKKSYGGGGGGARAAAAPKAEYETLAPMAQAALSAAVNLIGPNAPDEVKDNVIYLAGTFFDAMLDMCQRGKGKLERTPSDSGPNASPPSTAQRPTPNAAAPAANGQKKDTATQENREGKSAFGHRPERWPIETALCDPPGDNQRAAVVRMCKDHNVPEEAREPLRRLIAKEYGIKPTPSKGSFMLFCDWLRNASPEAIDQAVTIAMDPAEEFHSDQPDPDPVETPDDPRAAYLWIAQQLGWPGHGDGPQCATAFMKVLGRRVINAADLTQQDWLTLYKFALSVQADPSLEPLAFQTWKEQRAKAKEGVGV